MSQLTTKEYLADLLLSRPDLVDKLSKPKPTSYPPLPEKFARLDQKAIASIKAAKDRTNLSWDLENLSIQELQEKAWDIATPENIPAIQRNSKNTDWNNGKNYSDEPVEKFKGMPASIRHGRYAIVTKPRYLTPQEEARDKQQQERMWKEVRTK